MDFAFTEEQELFRRTVRQFAKEVLLPKYTYWDKTGESPIEVWRKLADLGLTGLRAPERYGGMNADFVTCGIACEETARGDVTCASVVTNSLIVGEMIARNASEEVKERYLGPLARAEISISVALTEPHCGSDAAALTTRAVRDGDHYVLTGEKTSITLATEAAAAIIWARTDASAGARGISAFLVPSDTPGLSMSKFNDIGMRADKRGAIHLDAVRIPAHNLVGEEGKGFHLIMNQFDYNRALIALKCIGLAEQTMEETIAYAKTRTAFGRPVASYQGVAFPIVESATLLEAARLLSYKVLWLRDHDRPHRKESAMVKWWVPRLAFETVHRLLLCYGHAGYGDDYPVGQRLRDVLAFEIGDGTAEIMKIVIARELLGEAFRSI